jgi:hypothetical protein
MSPARKMLMETLAGHMALLRETHPKKAAMPVTKKARQCVTLSLRQAERMRLAA